MFPPHHLREFCINVSQTGANEGVPTDITLLSECWDWESGCGSNSLEKIAPVSGMDNTGGRCVRQVVAVAVGVEVAASRQQADHVPVHIQHRIERRRCKYGEGPATL